MMSLIRWRASSLLPPIRLLSSTVDRSETEKFTLPLEQWWNTRDGPVAALHSMNTVRIPIVMEAILGKRYGHTNSKPLQGYSILDIGCGGGILSESLARLGANVTGIDPNSTGINVAIHHSKLDPNIQHLLQYKCCTVEDMVSASEVTFDCIVASEVIEHVADIESFIFNISLLVKTGGAAVFSTINRTLSSLLLAKMFAEYVMDIVPRGTHDWNQFVTPQELKDLLFKYNITPILTQGTGFNPLTNKWYYSSDTSINYCLYAIKK